MTPEEKTEYDKIYYKENKEKKKETGRLYYLANKDKIKERVKIYTENNKEKTEYDKIYYKENKEKKKETGRLYYLANKEKIKEYREKNKEKINEKSKEYKQTEAGKKTSRIGNWKTIGVKHDDYSSLYDIYINCKNCEECDVKLNEYGNGNHKCLDHDHTTGLFRNVLCCGCNLRRR